MTRSNMMLLATGVLLVCIPGYFTASMRLASTFCLIVGVLLLGAAVTRNGVTLPQSALLLLGASNLGFWLSFGLWHLRLKLAGPSLQQGIDNFSGALAGWVILFLLFSVYEGGICVFGACSGRQRGQALLGLVALVLQATTSLRLAYYLVQGV